MCIKENGNIGKFVCVYKVRGDDETAETLEHYTYRNIKSNIEYNLLTADDYVVYGRQDPHKATVKDVLNNLKENIINVSQLVEYRTYHCQYGEYSTEGVPLRDTGVRNGKQHSAILNNLEN
jgi:hypothetical protein